MIVHPAEVVLIVLLSISTSVVDMKFLGSVRMVS